MSNELNLNDPEVKKIVLARLKLLNQMPFLGKLASTMRFFIIDDDDDVPEGVVGVDENLGIPRTGYTDGRNIYYYRSFVKKLEPEEVVFLTAHEVMHIIKDHLSRVDKRDPVYWNMACDYVINAILSEHNIGKVIKSALLDKKKYGSDKTADEVYELLMKNNEQKSVTLDIHLDLSGENKSSDGSGGGTTIKVKVHGGKELTKEELDRIKQELKEKIVSIYNQEKDNPLSQPGIKALGLDRLVDEISNPKINWRNLLREFITSYMPHDTGYHVLSRKSFFSDFMFPGIINNEKVEVWVAIDTSGSITKEQLVDVRTELKNIVDTFDSFEMNILCFDVDVYNVQKFDEFDPDGVLKYNVKGGGGTSLTEVFNYFKENNISPKKLVVFTDGYIDGWGDPNYCDTIFIISKGGNKDVPYGVAVEYE